MPDGQVAAVGIDEIVKHLNRDIALKKRGFEDRCIAAGAGIKHILLNGGVEVVGQGVFTGQVGVHIIFPGSAAGLAVGPGEDFFEGALRNGLLFAIHGHGRFKGKIGIGEQGSRGGGGLERRGKRTEDFFHFSRTDMGLFAVKVIKIMVVDF